MRRLCLKALATLLLIEDAALVALRGKDSCRMVVIVSPKVLYKTSTQVAETHQEKELLQEDILMVSVSPAVHHESSGIAESHQKDELLQEDILIKGKAQGW